MEILPIGKCYWDLVTGGEAKAALLDINAPLSCNYAGTS